MTYEGRETAPKSINQNLFLKTKIKNQKVFFCSGWGLSVGTPGTLKALYSLTETMAQLSGNICLNQSLILLEKVYSTKRLVSALKKKNTYLK